MKHVCVFGMGGIGGYMTARFVSAKVAGPQDGLFVSCIARGESLKAIEEKGLYFRTPDGQEDFFRPDIVTDNPAALPEQDLIVLGVKSYHLAAACSAINPIITPKTVILPLLNGIDIYERIRAATPSGIVLPACIYISALRQEPGLFVHVGGKGTIVSGDDPRNKGFDPAPLASLMAKADIPFDWQADPFPGLWKKYIFIASFGLVAAMSEKSFGQILESGDLSAAVQNIMKEIRAIAAAKGAALPDSFVMSSYESARNYPYETTTSFARDVQIPGNPNESDIFGATIMRMGEELGIPTPATKAAHEAILHKT